MLQPELFGVVAMSRAVRDRNLDNFPLSQLFAAAGLTKRVNGDTTSWDCKITNRKAGKWNAPNGKAHLRQKGETRRKFASLLTKYDKATMLESELEGPFRIPGTETIDAAGRAALAQIQVDLATEFDFARELAIIKSLDPGSQTFEFQLEGAAASQSFSIDFGYATTHYTEGVLTGGLLGEASPEPAFGAWDTASTDILSQLAWMKRLIGRTTGYRGPVLTIADSQVVPYLLTNTDIKDLYGGTGGAQVAIESGGVAANQFLGTRWLFLDHQYTNESGATTDLWPSMRVAMMPMPNREWFEWHAGTYLVPGRTQADPATIRGGLSQWAFWGNDPVTVDVFAKERYFPVVHRPGAVVQLKADETATTPS